MKIFLEKIIKRNFLALCFVCICVTQLIPYFILYFVIGRWAVDFGFWNEIGRGVLEGKLPYRDFGGSYSPLFSFLLGMSFLIFNHFSSPVMLFIIFSLLSAYIFWKIAEIEFKESKEMATLLFLASPPLWFFTVFYGQDEIITCFFILLSYYFFLRKEETKAFITIALGYLFTKLTFLIYIPVYLIYSKKKLKNISITLFIILPVYFFLLLAQADIFYPLKYEKSHIEEICILSLIKDLTGICVEFPYTLFFVGIPIIFVYFFINFYKHKIRISESLLLVSLVFLIFAWKSMAFYRLALSLPLLLIYIFENIFENSENLLWIYFLYSFTVPLYRVFYATIPARFYTFSVFSLLISYFIKVTVLLTEIYIIIMILKHYFNIPGDRKCLS